MKNPWISYADHRHLGKLLRFFPCKAFLELHRWPCRFPWTEKSVSFFLSFDCDNTSDADLLPELLLMLKQYGIPAAFAVCGELVEKKVEAYEKITAAGHEIINHGYSKHCETLPDGSSHSTLFYNDLSENQIEEEIAKNHEVLENMLGVAARGFRVPHFGRFQTPSNIDLFYPLLKKQGYRYSSSVIMLHAKQRGYLEPGADMMEFPLSTRMGMPLSVFDSWNLLRVPGRLNTDDDFFPEFRRMVDTSLKGKQPIFLNVYFDPSHVVGFDGFEKCLQYLRKNENQIWIGTYSSAMQHMEDK